MSESFPIAAGPTPNWTEVWPRARERLVPFLAAIEEKTGQVRLAQMLLHQVERAVALRASRTGPAMVGATLGYPIEITEPVADIEAARGDRIAMNVYLEGSRIDEVDLPIFGHRVCRGVIVDAIAERCGWKIFGAFLRHTRHRDVSFDQRGDAWSAWRGTEHLASGTLGFHDEPFWAFHDLASWSCLLAEVWGPTASVETVVEDGRILVLEITDPIPTIRATGSRIDFEARLGGCAIARGSVPVPKTGTVFAGEIRAAVSNAAGFELCRAAVRGGLIGQPFSDCPSLRDRLASAARAAIPAGPFLELWSQPPAPGWARSVSWAISSEPSLIVGRRLPYVSAGGGGRRATLPPTALGRLLAGESQRGTPLIRPVGEEPIRAYYAPELFTVDWPNGRPTPAGSASQTILPILMYHRIAPTGLAGRDRWRLAPDRFAAHLAALESAGIRTVTFDEWARASLVRRPIPGPAVILTFDDGFVDFEHYASPILARHHFQATVFLVTGHVGGVNRWDHDAESEQLLDWDRVRRLHAAGTAFGSHTVTHPHLTLLPPEQMFDELFNSRITLEERLGVPITAIAYPYGDVDQVTRHLAGAAGYGYGLTCRGGPAVARDSLLDLPRIEVHGGMSTDELLASLGLTIPVAA
jgi:peptidoglycan/xylan/chitin deacetylase (PgdA/CDA1 family)